MKTKLSNRDKHILYGAYLVLEELNEQLWKEGREEALFSKNIKIQEEVHPVRCSIERVRLGIFHLLNIFDAL